MNLMRIQWTIYTYLYCILYYIILYIYIYLIVQIRICVSWIPIVAGYPILHRNFCRFAG